MLSLPPRLEPVPGPHPSPLGSYGVGPHRAPSPRPSLSSLPPELCAQVLAGLGPPDLARVEQVSRRLREVAVQPELPLLAAKAVRRAAVAARPHQASAPTAAAVAGEVLRCHLAPLSLPRVAADVATMLYELAQDAAREVDGEHGKQFRGLLFGRALQTALSDVAPDFAAWADARAEKRDENDLFGPESRLFFFSLHPTTNSPLVAPPGWPNGLYLARQAGVFCQFGAELGTIFEDHLRFWDLLLSKARPNHACGDKAFAEHYIARRRQYLYPLNPQGLEGLLRHEQAAQMRALANLPWMHRYVGGWRRFEDNSLLERAQVFAFFVVEARETEEVAELLAVASHPLCAAYFATQQKFRDVYLPPLRHCPELADDVRFFCPRRYPWDDSP